MTRSVLAASLVACLAGCGPAPLNQEWFARFAAVERGKSTPEAAATSYQQLAKSAVGPDDRCMALHYSARQCSRFAPEKARQEWSGLQADKACEKFHPRILFHLAQLELQQGQPGAWVTQSLLLARTWPETWWARRSLEELWRGRDNLGRKEKFVSVMVGLYPAVAQTQLAGHVLFYAAQAHLAAPCPRPGRALFHLLMVVDRHPHSPLWDDALWLVADLLRDLGRPADETRILEQALLPTVARGIDALADGFTGKVRLRLGRLYRLQGRYEEALRQLTLVVNVHSETKLKDDAFWELARVYRAAGDAALETRALQYLVRYCPWSRHKRAAEKRIHTRRVTE